MLLENIANSKIWGIMIITFENLSKLKLALSLALFPFFLPTMSFAASEKQNLFLHQIPQINGIAFKPGPSEEFLIATYEGVYSISSHGKAKPIAPDAGALTEITRHPIETSILLASGYRSKTEKLGVLISEDGGSTWMALSKVADKPVAFHSMSYSPSEPSTVYGAGKEDKLYVSKDGGKTWDVAGDIPAQAFDVTVSRSDANMVYLATREGLFKSINGGESWSLAHPEKGAATMVDVGADGIVRAFIYGYGFVTAKNEEALSWKKSGADFTGRAIMDIALYPGSTSKILGIADTGAVFVSENSGKSWKSFEGKDYMTTQRIAQGKLLYQENCAACHGTGGIGEKPENSSAPDENGMFPAPALNDNDHAWHHGDEQLIQTILEGSPRNERMLAWKDHGVSREEAESLVAYIKSLWSFRSLACQGSRHMSCMQ